MILSGKAIRLALEKDLLKIDPFDEAHIQPAHVDLHLGGETALEVPAKGFVAAQTKEKITLANNLCGFMEGRAGLAKQGLSVEQSSTFIEPGSDNHLTLEIFNASDTPCTLQPGQPIAKLYLAKITDEI
ncbi:MAG TPA: hypothetical protein VLE99_03235 [Candidatus Saccharimonadales bacterium]|nr:hypothetical protein [Candidatus Saccharimonadales bacterium]